MSIALTLLLVTCYLGSAYGQLPLYYKLKKIQGSVYNEHGEAVHVRMLSRQKLRVENSSDQEFQIFLQSLMLGRHGRKALQYLLTTNGKITVICSDKVGLMHREGKYFLMAGMTGPEEHQSKGLIDDGPRTMLSRVLKRRVHTSVHEENTIEFFKGSVSYGNDPASIVLRPEHIKLVDQATNQEIRDFSMDTICVEPIQWPELLYKNSGEFYYFCGIHEIHHTKPENVEIQLNAGDAEVDAYAEEMKAFKKRKKINRRYVRSLSRNGAPASAARRK